MEDKGMNNPDRLWQQLAARLSDIVDAHQLDLSGDVRAQLSSISETDAKHFFGLPDTELDLVVTLLQRTKKDTAYKLNQTVWKGRQSK